MGELDRYGWYCERCDEEHDETDCQSHYRCTLEARIAELEAALDRACAALSESSQAAGRRQGELEMLLHECHFMLDTCVKSRDEDDCNCLDCRVRRALGIEK